MDLSNISIENVFELRLIDNKNIHSILVRRNGINYIVLFSQMGKVEEMNYEEFRDFIDKLRKENCWEIDYLINN